MNRRNGFRRNVSKPCVVVWSVTPKPTAQFTLTTNISTRVTPSSILKVHRKHVLVEMATDNRGLMQQQNAHLFEVESLQKHYLSSSLIWTKGTECWPKTTRNGQTLHVIEMKMGVGPISQSILEGRLTWFGYVGVITVPKQRSL